MILLIIPPWGLMDHQPNHHLSPPATEGSAIGSLQRIVLLFPSLIHFRFFFHANSIVSKQSKSDGSRIELYYIIFVLLRLYKKRLFYLSVILYLPLNLNLVLQDHNYQNLFFPMTSSFLPYNLELTSGLLPSPSPQHSDTSITELSCQPTKQNHTATAAPGCSTYTVSGTRPGFHMKGVDGDHYW